VAAGTTAGLGMDVEAYLRRIGYDGPRDPSAVSLLNLHRRHLVTVPFENLDIALGIPIQLDPEALFDKVVIRKRGGFCYELNGLFHDLLGALGFRVDMLSARVRNGDGSFSQEFDHMLLKVSLDEPWLADVGFGDSFVDPLPFRSGVVERAAEKAEGKSRFWLHSHDGEWDLVRQDYDDAPTPLYRFTETVRQLSDFATMCHYHQTSPESHFTRNRICSKALPDGRVTIAGMCLIVTRDGVREESLLKDADELRDSLRTHFGVEFSGEVDWRRLTA
jgi:N-hydroxyarylamine O-acetyltransferase